jgi:hypothetical protein
VQSDPKQNPISWRGFDLDIQSNTDKQERNKHANRQLSGRRRRKPLRWLHDGPLQAYWED